MKVAILSDIHDNISNLEKALTQIKAEAGAIIFCGDMCAPSTAAMLAESGLPLYAFPGNNDMDQIGLIEMSGDKAKWFRMSCEFADIELEGKKIAFCHYPVLAEFLADSKKYDAVFHGHTHETRNEKRERTLLVNPGSVCGIQKGKPGQASFAIYDTTTNNTKIIEIK